MNQRRDAVLREMGLAPLWRLRGRSQALQADEPEAVAEEPAAAGPPARESGVVFSAREPQASHRPHPDPVAAAPAVDSPDERARRIETLDWEALDADIRACTACRLCERRRQAVPGVGDRQASWMFVGEGPGAEEDQRGEPFVGAAGKLLDAMLAAIGLKRGEGVYIANAVKCRPPHNRTPGNDEIEACAPYLARQIALLQPRLLVALGRPAARALLGVDVAIGAARGQVFRCRGMPVVVTYHPAYLLRNQRDKAKVWEDLCFARELMERATPA
ncbi:uracil-DNA glycosylase [Aromatoleum aromaticum]|uniref:Type-4 uracil-DNA glycosylase n=1 Tax=Aromatoleum aromaticum (strain DSM 19018 / LMG 30748 / EbN1) TaxID=76114 RepID=Q5NYN2_AROAE|nr:uracil-DNA glycosylase [Aromatoleum aromaticum]NMG53356.1 uracil-DNA glycosylase [Aromatoleum aromaticum]CAI09832.1 DNA polymerase-related protein,bacteriophage-type [Aromatoleum aromaticum EbN1]